MNNFEDKMLYLNQEILPELEVAFKRGDTKFHGIEHSHSDHHIGRNATDDIRHMRECHANVRLLEAEDLADQGKLLAANEKIISAIGYLIILHMRTTDKVIGEFEKSENTSCGEIK